MNPEHRTKLQKGSVVQLAPWCGNKAFAACLMIVDEVKSFGAVGYIQAIGENRHTQGGQAFYRAPWEEMLYIGEAAFVLDMASNAEGGAIGAGPGLREVKAPQ